MFDEKFWVAAAFVLFFVFVGRKLWTTLTGLLDQRSRRIREELEEAVRLREEAQELLATYQRQQREAAEEAERILAHARDEAERVAEEARTRTAEQLARREELAKEKIAQAELRTVQEIRARMVDIAIDATARVLAEGVDDARAAQMVDQAIEGVGRRLAG